MHLVQIAVSQIFVNCGRYIHNLSLRKASPHVPDESGRQPFPEWKRIDVIADALPDRDKDKVAAAGGTIALDSYREKTHPTQKRLCDHALRTASGCLTSAITSIILDSWNQSLPSPH